MNWFWHAIFIAFVVIPVAILWIAAAYDIVVRSDRSGVSRVLWLLAIFILPIVGALIYFLLRPAHDADRTAAAKARHASTASLSDELAQLNDLHSAGALSDAEFAEAKARVVGNITTTA